MIYLIIKIDKFISDHQPGFVSCSFTDALGNQHIIEDKVPVVSTEDLVAESNYPVQGQVACEILAEWKDEADVPLVKINTAKPWGIESIKTVTEFVVLKEQIEEIL